MRAVFVANWWYRRGGLGAVMLDEAGELERRGHEVVPFAAAHPENIATPWSRYFPQFVETAGLGAGMPPLGRAAAAARLIHNRGAARRFEALLDAVRPDLVHLHNGVRQLSPSVLGPAAARGIPIVMTLHDYSLVCPQGQLFKGERAACRPPSCRHGNPLPCLTNRCVRRNLPASALAAVEYGAHRWSGAYVRRATLLVAPGEFMARVLRSSGIPGAKIRTLPNGVAAAPPIEPPPATGGHLLYAGRVAREKGVDLLLRAARLLPEVPIVVAGDGPLRAGLEAEAPPSVRFAGSLDAAALDALRRDSVAAVSPSLWYENAPLAVIESMRAGRPVVATAIGGQPELIAATGLLVPPGDPAELARALRALWSDRTRAAVLGALARERFESRYTLERHVDGLERVYAEAMAIAAARSAGVPASA